jgi:hypothetical protein
LLILKRSPQKSAPRILTIKIDNRSIYPLTLFLSR